MKKTMVLLPIIAQSPVPFIKVYDYKDTIYTISKADGRTEFLPAEKVTIFDHLILAKGQTCNIISITSSEKGVNIK